MPKTPVDYSKTIIYKVCCKDINIEDLYIGHTTDLRNRRFNHKSSCNNETNHKYNYNVYKFIRDNGGWDNWELIPVEEYPCENINQALIRERHWLEVLNATLNKTVPSRTTDEYLKVKQQDIKDNKIQNYQRNKSKIQQYYKDNAEEKRETQREYYKNKGKN